MIHYMNGSCTSTKMSTKYVFDFTDKHFTPSAQRTAHANFIMRINIQNMKLVIVTNHYGAIYYGSTILPRYYIIHYIRTHGRWYKIYLIK